jgi:hypothetical protein
LLHAVPAAKMAAMNSDAPDPGAPAADSESDLAAGDGECPLPRADQTRNLLIFAGNWAILYLASPVTYVGIVHAALIRRLGFSDTLANLPASVYLWASVLPVIVAWYFPQVRLLRRLAVGAFLVIGWAGLLVALALLWLGPRGVLAMLVLHATVLGCAIGVVSTCQWEMAGRGITEQRRGQALGLAFGLGPVLAVISSLGSQVLLAGKVEGIDLPMMLPQVPFPANYVSLFGGSLFVMLLGAVNSSRFIVPLPAVDVDREPFLQGTFGGLAGFLRHRWSLIASLAYIGVYSGHEVLQNVSLYAEEVLGEPADHYAGLQLTLRFGFKIAAGFCLGWLLTRTNPKALLVTTALLTAAGVGWVLGTDGWWYLISFGILGAGELFGVYYPNYLLGCSPRTQMRRTMALASLVTMPVGFAPVFYGWISDTLGRTDRAFGLQMSFVAALLILAGTVALVLAGLPKRPAPPDVADVIQAGIQ